jgi:hypothetical protein
LLHLLQLLLLPGSAASRRPLPWGKDRLLPLFFESCYAPASAALPLIQKLVDHFETLFPYLAIDQVWILRKSEDGDGFQGWHQDMVERISDTIVINLGSEDNSVELATDQGLHVRTTNESDNELEKGTIEDSHNPSVHMDNTVHDSLRSMAIMMKN